MSSGGVPNGLWDRASSSIFYIWDGLLRPEQAHDERTERTHPNLPTISRHTRPLGNVLLGGDIFHWDTSPHPHYFQVPPEAQSRRETPGSGDPRQAESGGGSHALVGTCQRRAVSEGLLQPTGQVPPAPSGAGGATREEDSTSALDRVGEGRGVSAERNSGEGECRRDCRATGWGGVGWGGALGRVGRSNAAITKGLEYKCNSIGTESSVSLAYV